VALPQDGPLVAVLRNAGARNRRVFDGGAQAERAEPASGRRRADTA